MKTFTDYQVEIFKEALHLEREAEKLKALRKTNQGRLLSILRSQKTRLIRMKIGEEVVIFSEDDEVVQIHITVLDGEIG